MKKINLMIKPNSNVLSILHIQASKRSQRSFSQSKERSEHNMSSTNKNEVEARKSLNSTHAEELFESPRGGNNL